VIAALGNGIADTRAAIEFKTFSFTCVQTHLVRSMFEIISGWGAPPSPAPAREYVVVVTWGYTWGLLPYMRSRFCHPFRSGCHPLLSERGGRGRELASQEEKEGTL
jgi:hypothetical protein